MGQKKAMTRKTRMGSLTWNGRSERWKEERRETVGIKCQEINPTLEFEFFYFTSEDQHKVFNLRSQMP